MQYKKPIYFPTHSSEGYYKTKNSKFLSFLFACENLENIEKELDFLRKEYSDATHICYAWRLGFESPVYRINDDGEPSYSAGMSIYRKILSYGISNVLVAVVRYFGGTKLGISGLIEAYGSAAELAIQNTLLNVFVPKSYYKVVVPISKIHIFYKILNSLKNYEIISETFDGNEAIFEVQIPKSSSSFIHECKFYEFKLN